MRIKDRSAGAALAAAIVVAAAAAAVPAQAQAPAPTLAGGAPCYSPGDMMTFTGANYSPNSRVTLAFSGRGTGFYDTAADAAGKIDVALRLREEDVERFLSDDEGTREVVVTATDQARAEQTNDPQNAFAAMRMTWSRFAVAWNQVDDAMVSNRRLALDVVGFTGMAGKPVYLHYLRGGKRVASVRLGLLQGACGTLKKTLPRAFPRKIARPGKWTILLNTTRSAAMPDNGVWISVPVRVRR